MKRLSSILVAAILATQTFHALAETSPVVPGSSLPTTFRAVAFTQIKRSASKLTIPGTQVPRLAGRAHGFRMGTTSNGMEACR